MYKRFYMLCCSPALGSWLCILNNGVSIVLHCLILRQVNINQVSRKKFSPQVSWETMGDGGRGHFYRLCKMSEIFKNMKQSTFCMFIHFN
jgi:hypothetical protein